MDIEWFTLFLWARSPRERVADLLHEDGKAEGLGDVVVGAQLEHSQDVVPRRWQESIRTRVVVQDAVLGRCG